jgi:ADP-ribosylglycohydrolase
MVNRTRAEKKSSKPKLSNEAHAQAQGIANAVIPVSFTKQQRKEVQQAIESGMATIRAQANSKSREREKKVKQLQKQLDNKGDDIATTTEASDSKSRVNEVLPWGLLLISWIGMAAYLWKFA